MGRETTLRDIAGTLNLSVSTVARALADNPQISELTKIRVRACAAELGYVAHSAARAMRRGHGNLVGLIIPDVQNEFYGTLAKALAQCCDLAGYQLLLAITEDDSDSEERQVRGLSEARVAGVVIVPSPRPHRETLQLLERGPWVQLIRRVANIDAPWFGIDEERALETATAHLIELGHRRIGYVGGMLDLSTGRSRLRGFERAFARAKLRVPKKLIRVGPPRMQFAASAFASLWNGPERPTAIVTAGARLSAGVLDMIGRLKLDVPGDISVVGYGDAPWWNSDLSTVSLPVREIAMACGEFLLRRIRNNGHDDDPVTVRNYRAVHTPSLILRASTAPLDAGKKPGKETA
ncbi:MAG TPA: LacI family DNA-binding transcriptional regulator [Pseudorhodoplanes sp.]|jgi:LacI family transcriptional regulator|nr:LacI family DNA-binding transcriptional regulator [Pseudorhodoplanes sp.]